MPVMPVAHIVQGAPVPTALGWVAAVLLAAGGIGIFAGRSSAVEVAAWAVFGVGFTGAGSVIALTMLLPTSARISISLAAPPASGTVSSPLDVTVCARATDGSAATAPDGNNVLAVVVDGREAAIESTAHFAVAIPHGTHHLRVELLTADHHVFTPEVTADATLTVTSDQPLTSTAPCTSR
jgi:hypothetical protein